MPRATRRQLQSFDRDPGPSNRASSTRAAGPPRAGVATDFDGQRWDAPTVTQRGRAVGAHDDVSESGVMGIDDDDGAAAEEGDEYGYTGLNGEEDENVDGGSAWGDGDPYASGDGLEEEELEAYAEGADEDDDEEAESELGRSARKRGSIGQAGRRTRTLHGRGLEDDPDDPSDSASSLNLTPTKSKRGRPSASASASKRRKLDTDGARGEDSDDPAAPSGSYTPSPSKSNGTARSRNRATPTSKRKKKKAGPSAASNTNWWTKLLATAADAHGDDLALSQPGGGTGGFTGLNAADRYFLAAARPKVRKGATQDGFGRAMRGYRSALESETESESGSDDIGGNGNDDERGIRGKRGLLPLSGTQVLKRPRRKDLKMVKAELASLDLKKSYAYWRTLLLGSEDPTTAQNSSQAHSLLFFGHGSKRSLLNEFASAALTPIGNVVVINGLYPGIGIREVLAEVEGMFDGEAQGGMRGLVVEDGFYAGGEGEEGDGEEDGRTELKGLAKSAARIYKYFLPPSAHPRRQGANSNDGRPSSSEGPLFLVIHNIDSPTLRTPSSLSILSLLALHPRIHLVASFDHANTPILFSSTEMNARKHEYGFGGWRGRVRAERGFGWAWIRADTYTGYDKEMEWMRQQRGGGGAQVGPMGEGKGVGNVTEEGAQKILQSVPPMARRLFKLLATRQLDSLPLDSPDSAHPLLSTTPHAPAHAIDNDLLQRLARDAFIAREEERYNAQMGEFRDHGLIVEHVLDAEGRTGRWAWIPLGKSVLARVVSTMTGVEA